MRKRTLVTMALGMALLVLAFGSVNSTLFARPMGDDPIPVTRIGEFGTFGAFDATANYAYFAEGNRLNVVSFTDPHHPVIVGEAFSSIPFQGIKVTSDGTRLIAVGVNNLVPDSLTLYDVSDPTTPQEIDRVAFPYDIFGVRNILIVGERLYVASTVGVLIYRWDNNTLTFRGLVAGTYETPNIFVDGNTLVVARYEGNNAAFPVQLFDVSNDENPVLVGSVPTIGGVAIPANGYLYVTNFPRGDIYMDVWDIRNPSNPQVVASFPDLDWYPLARQGNIILTGNSSRWQFWDVSTPTAPTLAGEITGNSSLYLAKWLNPTTVYLDGITRALLPNFNTLQRQGTYAGRSYQSVIPIGNQFAYAVGYFDGIYIYDIADPTAPRLKSTVLQDEVLTPGSYWVTDQRLYISRETDVLVLDTSTPSAPQVIGMPPAGGRVVFAGTSNGYLYGKYTEDSKFYIVKESDLSAITVPFDPGDGCHDVDVKNNIIALHCDVFGGANSRIRLYDLTNPTSPTLRGTIETSYYTGAVTLQPPYVFMAYNDIEIYDISSLDAPTFIGIVPNTGQLNCFTLIPLRDNQYVRQCSGGQDDVLDLSNPYFPRTSRTFSVPDGNATVRGDLMFFAMGSAIETWHINYPFTYLPVDYDNHQYLPFVGRK